MDLLLQFQADQLDVPVIRAQNQDTTAMGAAYLAGLAEGVWPTISEVAELWSDAATFRPTADRQDADSRHHHWLRAVDRSRGWAIDT